MSLTPASQPPRNRCALLDDPHDAGQMRQVGDAWVAACLLQQRRHLAAMVARVLEEVRRRRSRPGSARRRPSPPRGTPADPQARRAIELTRPVEDARVGALARVRQAPRKSPNSVGAVRRSGTGRAGETADPRAIGPQDVVERAVDGPEERAAVALALVVGHRRTPRTSARSSSGCSGRGAGSSRRDHAGGGLRRGSLLELLDLDRGRELREARDDAVRIEAVGRAVRRARRGRECTATRTRAARTARPAR